jgi:hypothetical protein
MQAGSSGVGSKKDANQERVITLMSHLFVGSLISEIEDISARSRNPSDLEHELLSNKYNCPNGHLLTVSICSCSPDNLHYKKFVFRCQDDCEYNRLVGLDCGNTLCRTYQENS